jgi:4-amino-4-deoxy-L-arabinose transferase-like glycosyltransferase
VKRGRTAGWLGLLLAAVFLLAGWLTLGQYGITWDEPENFLAGELYWQFWRTGDARWLDFEGLKNQWAEADQKPYFYVYTIGRQERYPPFANTVSAIGAWALHERAGWLDPITAHHAAVPLFGALGVWVTFRFAWERRRRLSEALPAALMLAAFPLYWAHAHNNIKDVPMAALFAAVLWAGWRAFGQVGRVKWRWALLAGGMTGLGLATKANALFIAPILLLWLAWLYAPALAGLRPKGGAVPWRSLAAALLGMAAVAGVVLMVLWPYLWADPLRRLYAVLRYFATAGRGAPVYFAGRLYTAGVDLPWYYASAYLALTAPLGTLALGVLGLVRAGRSMLRREDTAAPLWLIWFLVTLGRVSLPGMVVYDGLRQIMELLPAWCLLAGLGADWCWEWMTRRLAVGRNVLAALLLLALMLPQALALARLYPYEGAFFNALAGGVRGAASSFPLDYWGQSYKDGVEWLNAHAGPGAWVAVPIAGHLARFGLRGDVALLITGEREDVQGRAGEGYVMVLHHWAWVPSSSLAQWCLAAGEPAYVLERAGAGLLSIYRWPCMERTAHDE